jgi:hypothetical protein
MICTAQIRKCAGVVIGLTVLLMIGCGGGSSVAPAPDVTAAFEYYLRHFNSGRPFILAGHSQGSAVLKYLMSGYMKSYPDVYQRMIAAYVVGQSITPQYLA